MKEKKRTEKQKQAGGGGGSIFDNAPSVPPVDQHVNVSCGPYAEQLPVVGMTVGEVRKRFADRMDIDPKAQAIVNGTAGGEDYILKAGEGLMFVKHAGEKGTRVVIEGNDATVGSDSLSVAQLAQRMGPGISTGSVVLPAGIRCVLSRGNITVWVYEQAPQIHRLSWIAENSPKPYGPGTKYRNVRIALPYLVIMAVFSRNGEDGDGMPTLTQRDECFFRTEPLKSLDDELSYPGLLNCSKWHGNNGPSLSWICTQHLKPNPQMQSDDPGQRFCGGFEAVRYCLLETSFNLSSEHHEGNSWYGESKKVDKRIATIAEWEANTKMDPLFVLDVPWIKSGHSVRQVVDRIFDKHQAHQTGVKNADDVAALIYGGA